MNYSEELLEKVARAICEADGCEPDCHVHHYPDKFYWETYKEQAQAALDVIYGE